MERIKVLVRIRPFLQNENSSGTGLNIDSDSTQKIEIPKSLKKFEATFDRVLSQKSTQKDVFNLVKPCIDLIKQGGNGALANLYGKDILGLKFPFPSLPEQQKIAECLSSVDDLIQAEADQLQALKEHKKGLMQKLFPNLQ